jgi:glycolate oxidase
VEFILIWDKDMEANLFSDLKNIVGESNISNNIYERVSYAMDPMPYDLEKNNIPAVVVKPGSTEEVSEIMNYANKHKISIYIHGSGTNFSGASRPKRRGNILLSTSRLDSISVDEDYMYYECGAGAICINVIETLEKLGYMLPLNPGSKMISTMGGLVSTNTVGHMVDSHPLVGRPIDHIMGLEVVLPTGEIVQTGTKSLRRISGIDLTRLFVGMEGLFGVITKIRMRLIGSPKMVYAVASFKKSEDVAYSFMDIYRNVKKGVPIPLYGEFLDHSAALEGFKMVGLEPPGGAVALAITTGSTIDEATYNAEKLCTIFRDRKAINAYIVEDKNLQGKIWGARDYILHCVAEAKNNWTAIEVGPALPYLAEALNYLKHVVPRTLNVLKDFEVYTYGHLGACSLHGLWSLPKDWPDNKKREACREVFSVEREMNLKYEGCGGELGQLAGRIPFVKKKYGERGYAIFVNMKKMFDPNNILNTGNLEGEGV